MYFSWQRPTYELESGDSIDAKCIPEGYHPSAAQEQL